MTAVAAGLRVVSALRLGAHLTHRSQAGAVVHLYRGPLTRTGRSVPHVQRPVCGTRTRRLSVLACPLGAPVDLDGRRFCRRCTSSLPPSLGLDVHQLVSRDDWATAYRHLTEADLIQAARWTNDFRPGRTEQALADNFQVGNIASIVLGESPMGGPVSDVLLPIRRRLVVAEMTDDQRAEIAARRVDRDAEVARVVAARKKSDRIARDVDRRNGGGHEFAWERELTKTA